MRCKPDQICRIVGGSFPENKNRLVKTEKFIWTGEWKCIALQTVMTWNGLVNAGAPILALDNILEPLYDGDQQDQTLAWTDVPKVKETQNG